MALNPPLMTTGGLPMGVVGERFMCERNGIKLSAEVHGLPDLKMQGNIYVTSKRICFVNKHSPVQYAGQEVKSLDIPLANIEKQEFKQPVFGANYLSLAIHAIPTYFVNYSGIIKFKLTFTQGGCDMFLRVWLPLMHATNAPSTHQAQFFSHLDDFLRHQGRTGTSRTSDPTHVYISQPDIAVAPPIGPIGAGYASTTMESSTNVHNNASNTSCSTSNNTQGRFGVIPTPTPFGVVPMPYYRREGTQISNSTATAPPAYTPTEYVNQSSSSYSDTQHSSVQGSSSSAYTPARL